MTRVLVDASDESRPSSRLAAKAIDSFAAAKRLEGLDSSLASTNTRVTANEQSIAATRDSLTETQAVVKAHADHLTKLDGDLAQASSTAKEALERANAAHKLAEGKLLYEVQLVDDSVAFNLESASLPDKTKQLLMAFADQLKAENKNVFIEVQGHTDSSGSESTNYDLGMKRAKVVRDFLHKEAGLPMHRLSAVTYGESKPVADNKTRDGRVKNRRVTLVVLK